jgi:hypothetical protein
VRSPELTFLQKNEARPDELLSSAVDPVMCEYQTASAPHWLVTSPNVTVVDGLVCIFLESVVGFRFVARVSYQLLDCTGHCRLHYRPSWILFEECSLCIKG